MPSLPCKHLDLNFDPPKPERLPGEASVQLGPDYMLPVYPSACPDLGCCFPPPGPKTCQVQLHNYHSRSEETGTGGSLELNGQPGYQEPARAPVQREIILNKKRWQPLRHSTRGWPLIPMNSHTRAHTYTRTQMGSRSNNWIECSSH